MNKIYITLAILIGIQVAVVLLRKMKLVKLSFCLQSLVVIVLASFLNKLFQVDILDKYLKVTENFRPIVEVLNEISKWLLSIIFTLGLVLTFSKDKNAKSFMTNVMPVSVLIAISFVLQYIFEFAGAKAIGVMGIFQTAIILLLMAIAFVTMINNLAIGYNYKSEYLTSLITVLALIGAVLPQATCGLIFVGVYAIKKHLTDNQTLKYDLVELENL